MSRQKNSEVLYVPQALRRLSIHEAVSHVTFGYPAAQLIQQVANSFTAKLSPSESARFNGRLERGLQLALSRAVHPVSGSANRFQVNSATGTGAYLVDLEKKTCECPDSQKGHVCKHRIAAYYYAQAEKLQAPGPAESVSREPDPASTNREAQILKDIGFSSDDTRAIQPPSGPIHRLGSLYSRYLHGADLDGKAYRVTIRDIKKEKVIPHPSQPQQDKWCLWVAGLPEGLPSGILFGVRGEKDLLGVFGRVEITSLKGKQLVIYPFTTSVAGQNTVSIRFRSAL